jgi:hypothetical protein
LSNSQSTRGSDGKIAATLQDRAVNAHRVGEPAHALGLHAAFGRVDLRALEVSREQARQGLARASRNHFARVSAAEMRGKAHRAAFAQLGHEIERGKTPGALVDRREQQAPLHRIARRKVGHAGDVGRIVGARQRHEQRQANRHFNVSSNGVCGPEPRREIPAKLGAGGSIIVSHAPARESQLRKFLRGRYSKTKKRLDQLQNNLAAVELTLTQDELRQLDEVCALAPEYPRRVLRFQGADRLAVVDRWERFREGDP